MGSCLSKKCLPTYHTKKRPRSSKKKKQQQQHPAAVLGGAPALPSSPPEEEAVVKEVLTETPTSSALAAVSNSWRAEGDANVVKPPHKVSATTPPTSAVNGCRYGLGGRSDGEEGASTEICSASESFSVSTTLTEKRDAGAEDLEEQTSALRKRPSTRRRPPDRSPNTWKSYHQRTRSSSSSGDLPSRRRELKCGAGGGKSSPSPVKRSSDGRSFPGREAASTARQRAANGKVAAAGEARRERGERSGRGRSASPAAKRVAAGGCGEIRGGGGAVANRSSPMRRKAGPWRATPEQTPRREDDDDRRQQMMVMRKGGGGGGGSGGPEEEEEEEGGEREEEGEVAMMPPAPVSDEMLENPLVSLECFIFL